MSQGSKTLSECQSNFYHSVVDRKKTFKKIFVFYLLILCIVHRCDSISGTDYIANPFFLNLRVFTTKIENIR